MLIKLCSQCDAIHLVFKDNMHEMFKQNAPIKSKLALQCLILYATPVRKHSLLQSVRGTEMICPYNNNNNPAIVTFCKHRVQKCIVVM